MPDPIHAAHVDQHSPLRIKGRGAAAVTGIATLRHHVQAAGPAQAHDLSAFGHGPGPDHRRRLTLIQPAFVDEMGPKAGVIHPAAATHQLADFLECLFPLHVPTAAQCRMRARMVPGTALSSSSNPAASSSSTSITT